eukprot:2348181-Amphidinium_carterae.1
MCCITYWLAVQHSVGVAVLCCLGSMLASSTLAKTTAQIGTVSRSCGEVQAYKCSASLAAPIRFSCQGVNDSLGRSVGVQSSYLDVQSVSNVLSQQSATRLDSSSTSGTDTDASEVEPPNDS